MLQTLNTEDFRTRHRGPVLEPGQPGYDEACALWNGMIRRRPAVVARCTGVADVREALRFARETGLPLAVKSVGHNIAGRALNDGGLVLDLSGLRGIRPIPEERTVHVQPGASWGDVDRETQAFGLAVPGGIVSSTGVAGLTVGGGFGWLTRKHGFTCDNVLSFDVVTADGAYRTVRPGDDLFWGLAGGGGHLGVVTSFEFRMHPVGPEVMGGMILFPMDRAPEIFRFFREFTAEAPEELTCLLVLRPAPAAPFLPPHLHGSPVVGLVACHAGSLEAGRKALEPVKALREPLADRIAPTPFVALQRILDAGQPAGRNYYWKSEYLGELPDELGELLIRGGRAIASPHSAILVFQLGGAVSRIAPEANAASNREARYLVNVAASWTGEHETDREMAWARSTWESVRGHSTGTYLNFLPEEDLQARREHAHGSHLRRLEELKARYDPEGLLP